MTNRCLYHASFKVFLSSERMEILGILHDHYHGEALTTTHEAWKGEIELMQEVLQPWADEAGEIVFEYDIPRLGKRIDVVLLLRGIIFCLEFKVGQKDALQADVEQVMDYALDLKNFHRFSHDRIIVPILIPTNYERVSSDFLPSVYDDAVYNPLIVGASQLQQLLVHVLEHAGATASASIDNWIISPYTPTPTIIEAARTLYESHSVEDITRHEADKVSTDATIDYLLRIIDQSKRNGQKSICFVTGVPGAGKTLVGLDVAIKQTYKEENSSKEDGAVYREFIQIIHRYRDNMLAKIKNPVENGRVEIDPEKAVKMESAGYGEVEHVAIFDEAQRSWTHKRIADYLKRGGTYGNKLKVPNFPFSEAEFLIWSLDQREDWAVIICLVGGGQEINTGEAGITAWIEALNHRFKHWQVYISNKLTEPEYAEGKVNELLQENGKVTFSDSLHLAVSLRSFRAERLSSFVHSMLSFSDDAPYWYKDVTAKGYPIVLTRDMDKARQWLRSKARGSQQTGVMVSKVAARFKPLAVNILAQGDENAVHWFLEDKTDIRSSNYLEDAATEIQVQGLELDFACVLWDADMRCTNGHWEYFKFNGKNKWNPVANTPNGQEEKKYMLNAYRVLLTRARQGIVICVPSGNNRLTPEGFPEDATRLPEFYNGTYEYLKSLGIEEIW